MRRITITSFFVVVLIATAALAQPTLDSLWPNADGTRFAYEFRRIDLMEEVGIAGPAYLVLEGCHTTFGGEAQILLGEHPQSPTKSDRLDPALPGVLSVIWRARPDLRETLTTRFAAADKSEYWRPLFLHPGYFMKSTTSIQMWQDIWNHPTWTYLGGEPSVGASFTHQLLPEITDDIFLHGTVVAIDAVVTTVNGTYTNAVKVDYLVDLGISAYTDENGIELGTIHGEHTGHVIYVPGVGPVESIEEFMPFVWADFGTNNIPDEIDRWLGVVVETQSLSLAADPVAQASVSWDAVKLMYR